MGTALFERVAIGGFLLAGGLTVFGSVAPARAAQASLKPRFVQKEFFQVVTGSSVSVTLRRPNAAGNLILAYVVWDNGSPVALSDTNGNAYLSAVGPTQAAGDSTNAQIFYAQNVAGGSNTVTASFATAITVRGALYVLEYSGLDRSAPLDATVAASGSAAAMDSGLLTTATADELLFMGAESTLAAGQLYGDGYTWPFVSGWQSHLDTPGSIQMGYVKFLFTSRPWYDLIPDQSHSVVTAGYGTFVDSGALGDSDYLTAARTPDGALYSATASLSSGTWLLQLAAFAPAGQAP